MVLLTLYFVFNLAVGGSTLPNSFAAKTAYYGTNSRLDFVRTDWLMVFASGSCLVLLPFALGVMGREIGRFLRRRPAPAILETGWTLAVPLAYLVLLPFAHRFERYLVPALPTFVLLGLMGIRDAALWVARRFGRAARSRVGPAANATADARPAAFPWRTPAGIGALVVLAAALALPVAALSRTDQVYRIYCQYHWARHERTGRWLAEHTPQDAVIAAHDVGAIAYYSRRKVVDMVGVVLPEAVRHLNHPDYYNYLGDLFRREKVTYLAVLRNWCAVDNVAPLFLADPQPEIMEVFPWIPGRTHLAIPQVQELNNQAYAELRGNNAGDAVDLLQQALGLDQEDALSWLLLGIAQQMEQHLEDAETSYRRALALFPDYAEAHFNYARLLQAEGRNPEALKMVQACLQEKPDYPGAEDLRKSLGQ